MSHKKNAAAYEFSRPLAVETVQPDKLRHETIAATPEECVALAARFGLRAIKDLSAQLTVRRVPASALLRIDGAFQGNIVQACVVSLQDVPERVAGTFDTYLTQNPADIKDEDDIDFAAASDMDDMELIENGILDMGELVAQYFSLDINPYPRAPGVSLAAQQSEAGLAAKNSPFHVLDAIKGES
jgi:hypothetical protein